MNAIKASILILLSLMPTCFIAILVIKGQKWKFVWVAITLSVVLINERNFLMFIDTIQLSSAISKRRYNFIRRKHLFSYEKQRQRQTFRGKAFRSHFRKQQMKLISAENEKSRILFMIFPFLIFSLTRGFLSFQIFCWSLCYFHPLCHPLIAHYNSTITIPCFQFK